MSFAFVRKMLEYVLGLVLGTLLVCLLILLVWGVNRLVFSLPWG